MGQGDFKVCPQCQTAAAIDAPHCQACGHVYRTQFLPPDQTQMFQGPPPQGLPPQVTPYQGPPYQQQYQPPPYGHPPAHYHPTPAGDVIQLPPGAHSQVIAVLLAVFCCAFGGQLYNRQYLKAVVMALIAMVCGVVTGGASALITYPVFVADAVLIAGRLHRGEPVRQWQFF